jgi:hypothetical protein
MSGSRQEASTAGRSSTRSSARSARRYHAPALISIGSVVSP